MYHSLASRRRSKLAQSFEQECQHQRFEMLVFLLDSVSEKDTTGFIAKDTTVDIKT
jgi:hypothetical protein